MDTSHEKRERLLQKQKKEKKDLQSKIQALKKTVTKGDKKKKKEVQESIAQLELEINRRHEAELSELKIESKQVESDEEIADSIENLMIGDKKQAKVSKAQKRRDKKAAEQKVREKKILEQEKENEAGPRHMETKKISEILKKDGLMIHEVEADGNCLYNSVSYQLKLKANISFGVAELRRAASKVMKSSPYDYLPFLSNATTGEMMTEEEYFEYCDKVANTCDWGGEVELRALSHFLKRPIKVIQSDGPILVMGEEYSDNEVLVVCYHRHMYKLGEHYNSVKALEADEVTSENKP